MPRGQVLRTEYRQQPWHLTSQFVLPQPYVRRKMVGVLDSAAKRISLASTGCEGASRTVCSGLRPGLVREGREPLMSKVQ